MKHYLTPFVMIVVALAAAAGVIVPSEGFFERPGLVGYLSGLAFIAGAARVRIPGLGTHMSAVDPIVFCALAALGPLAACAVALAAVCGASLRSRHTIRPIQVAFNGGNVFLSTAAAYGTFALAGGNVGAEVGSLLAPLSVAAAAYFAVNSLLTTAVLKLAGRPGGFASNWRRSFLWSMPAYAGGMVLGVALYVSLAAHAAWGAGLALVACWLLVRFFEAHAAKENAPEQATGS